MGMVGCYDLHVYCDLCGEKAEACTSPQTAGEARNEMRQAGWEFTKLYDDAPGGMGTGTVYCPTCRPKKPCKTCKK